MWTKFISDPQQFANAYLSTQEFKPSNYESEQDML